MTGLYRKQLQIIIGPKQSLMVSSLKIKMQTDLVTKSQFNGRHINRCHLSYNQGKLRQSGNETRRGEVENLVKVTSRPHVENEINRACMRRARGN